MKTRLLLAVRNERFGVLLKGEVSISSLFLSIIRVINVEKENTNKSNSIRIRNSRLVRSFYRKVKYKFFNYFIIVGKNIKYKIT